MRDEFDDLVKTTIADLDQLNDMTFETEKTWAKIERNLSRPSDSSFFYFILCCEWVYLGLFLFFFISNPSFAAKKSHTTTTVQSTEQNHQNIPIHTESPMKTSNSRSNNLGMEREKHHQKSPKDIQKITNSTIQPLVLPDVKNVLEYELLERSSAKEEYPPNRPARCAVRIYRPRRYVGSSLVFKLKANEVLVDRIKNGRWYVYELNAMPTRFSVGKQTLDIKLQPNETYYLRVTYKGFPIGKPIVEWIAQEFAEKELTKLVKAKENK